MPHTADITTLEEVAALIWEAHDLYEGVLAHLRDDTQRDALCGVIAVRGALHMRLQDQMTGFGHVCARRAPDVQGDARCIGIYRQLSQGDHDGALAQVAAWDAGLRDRIAARIEDPRLTSEAVDNLRFTIQILDAAPARFAGPTRLSIAS